MSPNMLTWKEQFHGFCYASFSYSWWEKWRLASLRSRQKSYKNVWCAEYFFFLFFIIEKCKSQTHCAKLCLQTLSDNTREYKIKPIWSLRYQLKYLCKPVLVCVIFCQSLCRRRMVFDFHWIINIWSLRICCFDHSNNSGTLSGVCFFFFL